jgi:hypothetical protein
VISVLVLQDQMDLLQGERGSCSETSVTSPQVERVNVIKEEDLEERTTVPVIKTEPKVSCVCGECVRISYRLYPELPAPLSVCTCETKI